MISKYYEKNDYMYDLELLIILQLNVYFVLYKN
jgi:hypothetical protein